MQRWDYLAEVIPPCAIDSWPSSNRENEGRNVQYLSNNNILNPKPQAQILTPTTKSGDHMQKIGLLKHPGDAVSARASGLVVKSNVAIVGPRVRFPAGAFYVV